MSDFLLTVPTSLVCRVLCDWLENQDLPRLDSAYCSQHQRSLLFDVFRSEEFVLEIADRGDMIQFVFKRGIKVTVLALYRAGKIMEDYNYLQQNERYINDLSINCTVMPAAAPLFHNLKTLKFMNGCDLSHSCLLTLLKHNPCLESVDIHAPSLNVQSTDISELHLPHLQSLSYFDKIGAERTLLPLHTPSLLKLNVKKHGPQLFIPSEYATYMPEIASRCPNLRTLSLYRLFFVNIATLWPNLVHLSIDQSYTLSDSHILLMAQNLKHLRVVSFTNNTMQVTPRAVHFLTQYCFNTLEILYISFHRTGATFPLTDTQRTMCRKLHTFGWYPAGGQGLILLHNQTLSAIPRVWVPDRILEMLTVVQDMVEVVDFSHCLYRAYSTFTSPLAVFFAVISQFPRLRQINMDKCSARVEI